MLLEILREIWIIEEAQWRQFWLWEILYLSILAILSWADSYRKISLFIKVHFEKLKRSIWLKLEKDTKLWNNKTNNTMNKREELEKI